MLAVVIGHAAPFRVENNAVVIRVPSHVILLRYGIAMGLTYSSCSARSWAMAASSSAAFLAAFASSLAFASAKTIAIMQIVNIINCDMVNLTLGIITLVFLNDPEVRDHLRFKGVEI